MGVSVGYSIYNAPTIYESGAGGGGGGGGGLPIAEIYNFPSGYTPLEKIVFEGKTAERVEVPLNGYRANYNKTDNIVELIAKVNNTDVNNCFFRYVPVSPNDSVSYYPNEIDIYSNNSSYWGFEGIAKNLIKEKFTLKYRYNQMWLNDRSESYSWFTTINTKTSICICSSPVETTRLAYMDIFSFKIYEPTGNVIFFGVPAYDENNNVDGLIDIITNEFFQHKWTT